MKFIIRMCIRIIIIFFSLLFVSCRSVSYIENNFSARKYKIEKGNVQIEVKESFYVSYQHTNLYAGADSRDSSSFRLFLEEEFAYGKNENRYPLFWREAKNVLLAIRIGPGGEFVLSKNLHLLAAAELTWEVAGGFAKGSEFTGEVTDGSANVIKDVGFSYPSIGIDGRVDFRFVFENNLYLGLGGRFGIGKIYSYSDDLSFKVSDDGMILKYGAILSFGRYFKGNEE